MTTVYRTAFFTVLNAKVKIYTDNYVDCDMIIIEK